MNSKRILLAAIFLVAATKFVFAGAPEEGKQIFISRCAGCHNVNKVLTGPALAGVDTRHSMTWIVSFVNSSQTVIKSGDKDAVALYQRFNGVTMPDHPDLTTENVKNIIDYINSATVITDVKAPFAKPSKLRTPWLPLSISRDYPLLLMYLGVVALLIGILLFAVRLNDFRRNGSEE
jgi:mono/diheme cytochrome c family protein